MTIEGVLTKEFCLSGSTIKLLNGYANANYLISTKQHKYIFKSYTDLKLQESVEAESKMLLHLKSKGVDEVPEPIPFSDGSFSKKIELDGREQLCRLLTFVDGGFLGEATLNSELVKSLGNYIAQLNNALLDFDHVAYRAKKSNWDLQYVQLNKPYVQHISSSRKRKLVSYFFQQYESSLRPILQELRMGCIHGDFNEWNILLNDNKVKGVIDFGDASYTHIVNELAIAATYVCYLSRNPLDFTEDLLQSYHEIFPLEEKEVTVLYWLIAMRLCTSICNSSHSRVNDPENSYASVSEEKAWSLLEKWLRLGPKKVECHFRKVLGFSENSEIKPADVLDHRNEHLSRILSVSYQKPIVMERAAFQYMFDSKGNSFLDAYNNIPHVGHQHPKVVEAAKKQMTLQNTNTRYLYPELSLYAEKLLSKFPKPLNKVFFVNSGSAASDLAIRLAKAYTGKPDVLVMEHGYHGNTQIGIDISDYKFSNPKGHGQAINIFKTTIPDTYRGQYNQNDGTAGSAYAQEAIKNLPETLAAFISEPIVGCGGQVPLAKGYLEPMYHAIHEHGGVCISDEVQTGFGRLGNVFWGFEQQEVVPDIVILGKPMGNGHPIGAVVTTDEIAASFEKGVEFFSSFGGNPVSCVIGMAVLDIIEQEELQKNALQVGNYYQKCLYELQKPFQQIGDLRGSGLFLGIDIVKPGTKTPDTELASHLKNGLREQHILVSTDGPADNVIKSKPPLCFTKENVDEVISTLKNILITSNS
ncbi:MAG: aminotransferase class III-fold pyridoxal phosphate-dependent enzyme [Croceivirga sp.]